MIVTPTGRFMKFNQNTFNHLVRNRKTILLSHDISTHKQLLLNIYIPEMVNSDDYEIALLLIFDLLKLKYYHKYRPSIWT